MAEYTPKLSFTSRDFPTIVTDLQSFIQETRPTVWSDFFDSNTGMALIAIAAMVGDMLSVGQDITAQELFLATCQRYESALRFARSVGYVPSAASPASVTVLSTLFPDALTVNGGTVLAGSTIKGINGLSYELLADVPIAPGDTLARLLLVEGTSYSEEFAAASQQNQEVFTSNGIVAAGSWVVYVGDPTDPDNLWVQVDNVQFEASPTQTYDVYFDGQGRLHIRFGDGSAGKIPDATITVNYRTTNGSLGNAPVASITGAIKVQLQSPGTGTVSVTFINQDDSGSTSGGTQLHNGESLGTTVASATQTGAFANTPLQSGTATIVVSLTGGGGAITLQDNGAGQFTVVANTTARSLVSSSLTYSDGAWSLVFDAALAVGGTIIGTYYTIVAGTSVDSGIIGAATGGADVESLAQLKVNIPAYIRSQDKIIALTDYNTVLLKLAGIALVFTDLWLSSYSANAVKVHVWTNETFQFQSEDSSGVLQPVPSPYTRYAQVQQDQVNTVQAYLASRTLLTVHNVILRPTMLWADIYLGTVDYDQRLNAADVRAAISAAVIAVFQASSGFIVYLSELVNGIRNATGVVDFLIERIATGTQQTSDELQGSTLASTTFSGTLLFPVITPRSVVITIDQTSSLTIVLSDDGAGNLVLTSGTIVLSAGTINYRTGAWSATFTTALIANQNVTASYANVTNDYRRAQVVTFDDASGNPDPWPNPGVPTTNPVTPPYKDGLPQSATRAGSPQTPPFATGDLMLYQKLQDISVNAVVSIARFYDDTYLYNNEIYYDSVDDLVSSILCINLRRLVFDLNPVTV